LAVSHLFSLRSVGNVQNIFFRLTTAVASSVASTIITYMVAVLLLLIILAETCNFLRIFTINAANIVPWFSSMMMSQEKHTAFWLKKT